MGEGAKRPRYGLGELMVVVYREYGSARFSVRKPMVNFTVLANSVNPYLRCHSLHFIHASQLAGFRWA